jgi:Na+/proline symporter
MDIYTITIAISILVYIAIGNYAGKGIRNLDDYYVAGRRAPTILIVGTLVASVMSSTMFLGEAGFAYETQGGPYVLFQQATCWAPCSSGVTCDAAAPIRSPSSSASDSTVSVSRPLLA